MVKDNKCGSEALGSADLKPTSYKPKRLMAKQKTQANTLFAMLNCTQFLKIQNQPVSQVN